MIRTEILRDASAPNRVLEHAAKRHAIHDSALNPKSDDPPRVLIHDDQYPVRAQGKRLASQQVDTPQAVFHVAEERQP
jgi:hypothetical protein